LTTKTTYNDVIKVSDKEQTLATTMQGEANEALAKYEGAKIISDADTSNSINLKLATDTQKLYADKASKAVA
jgi:hypothetical protein